jgi:hypothetical protein
MMKTGFPDGIRIHVGGEDAAYLVNPGISTRAFKKQ